MLDETQIQERYAKFMEYVEADPRHEKLKEMYAAFGDELILAPASSKMHYHNSFPGGYIDHVVRVVEISNQLAEMYMQLGGTLNFTTQELNFAALHHDLGKLGTPDEGPYYVEQESDWHRKKGEMYKWNESIQYMKVTDRALMLLQQYGISISQNEWLGIRLSDGMYDEATKPYLVNYSAYPMKTNIHRILHWADHMASQIENDKSRF